MEDAAFRGGLCLAVASMDPVRLSPPTLRALDDVLTHLYTSAPDGGTHGAAEYALRHRGLPLPAIAPTQSPVEGRRWFINRQGITLIAVEPGEFHPLDYDRPRDANGLPPQTVVLTRPFFMGDQEVTAEWFRRFLKSADHPTGEELGNAAHQARLEHGLARINHLTAVLFCNWLSRAEGRKPCYRRSASGAGIVCDFTTNGYRLPTDAEWEYASRCATTSRFFVGDDASRMLEYGRMFATSPGLGKCFFPNPLGFFDMLGNGWEMCWDEGINQYGNGLAINPVGPVGTRYAMRGGAAEAGLFYLHGSARPTNNVAFPEAFRVVCGPLHAEDAKGDNLRALSALNQLLKRFPKSSLQLWAERGRLHAELGQYDEAAADFAKVFGRAQASVRIGDDFARWEEVFPRLIQIRPRDARLWHAHLPWLARRGRWREAVAVSARLTELAPANPLTWHLDAALRLQLGDADGYRRDCRQMLRHFVTSNDPVVADKTAKTCLLLPDVVADLKPVLQLAERAVAGTQQHPAYRWFLICKALADYRTLRFVAAINSIQKVDPKSEGGVLDATAYLILALSEQRRGRFVEARQAFTRAAGSSRATLAATRAKLLFRYAMGRLAAL